MSGKSNKKVPPLSDDPRAAAVEEIVGFQWDKELWKRRIREQFYALPVPEYREVGVDIPTSKDETESESTEVYAGRKIVLEMNGRVEKDESLLLRAATGLDRLKIVGNVIRLAAGKDGEEEVKQKGIFVKFTSLRNIYFRKFGGRYDKMRGWENMVYAYINVDKKEAGKEGSYCLERPELTLDGRVIWKVDLDGTGLVIREVEVTLEAHTGFDHEDFRLFVYYGQSGRVRLTYGQRIIPELFGQRVFLLSAEFSKSRHEESLYLFKEKGTPQKEPEKWESLKCPFMIAVKTMAGTAAPDSS